MSVHIPPSLHSFSPPASPSSGSRRWLEEWWVRVQPSCHLPKGAIHSGKLFILSVLYIFHGTRVRLTVLLTFSFLASSPSLKRLISTLSSISLFSTSSPSSLLNNLSIWHLPCHPLPFWYPPIFLYSLASLLPHLQQLLVCVCHCWPLFATRQALPTESHGDPKPLTEAHKHN